MSALPPVAPQGIGNVQGVELLLRQVLLEGLVELAGDVDRIEEICARPDDLLQGSQEETVEDFRRALLRMAVIGAEDGITVGTTYPLDDAHYPFISVRVSSDAESEAGASMGDVVGERFATVGDTSLDEDGVRGDGQAYRFTYVGGDHAAVVEVGCWSTVYEASMLLLNVVQHLLFRHKGRLAGVGLRNATWAVTGFDPSNDYPLVRYTPVVNVNLDWTYQQTRISGGARNPVQTRASYNKAASTFTN